MNNHQKIGRPKTPNPKCRVCGILLVTGENCVPSAIRRGEYLCREHKREKERSLYHQRQVKNPERQKLKTKEYRKKYPHIELKHRLRSKFDMSIEDYNTLLENQQGRCAICNRHQDDLTRRLAVDHCHQTNRIRGLLCTSCNSAIGILGDTTESLQKVVEYLR